MDAGLRDLGEYIAESLGDDTVNDWTVSHGELTVVVSCEHVLDAIKFLKSDARCLFDCLIDIAGVDYPDRGRRFDVVYHLLSPRQNMRIRVKTSTDEATPGSEHRRRVSSCQLVRAGSLRSLRDLVFESSGPAAHSHGLRIPGPPAAEGLSR